MTLPEEKRLRDELRDLRDFVWDIEGLAQASASISENITAIYAIERRVREMRARIVQYERQSKEDKRNA